MTKPHIKASEAARIIARDGFQNIVANLGTSRDKSFGNGWVSTVLTDQQLLDAYRESAVAKALIDYPAEDACREWRAWQATKDQISALEAEEKRLGLVGKMRDAITRARLFGGAAVFIGTGDADISKPLNPATIRKDGLRYLTVLDRTELGAAELNLDPSQPGYGLPQYYRLNAASGQHHDIHPSRLVLLKGAAVPSNSLSQGLHGWGDSELQAAFEKIGHLDATLANIAALVFEAKIDVVRIKDFTQNLRDGGSAYEELMLRRFGLAMAAKGINGTLMLDAEEEYDQKSANFSTLPDIVDRFMQAVAAAARIPMTRLFGTSPAGMNATGESDLRTYYDQVKQTQSLDIEPAMQVLDECLIRSALGARPTEVHFNWRSLWQVGEKDRAEIATKLVTAAKGLVDMDAAAPEAIGKATVNALTESGAFPGLESAVEEFGEFEPEEDQTDPLTGDPVEGEDA